MTERPLTEALTLAALTAANSAPQAAHSRLPAGWSPSVSYTAGGAAEVITLGTGTPAEGEWDEDVRALGVVIPDGYRAILKEVRHDPGAWVRRGQGEEAVTEEITRRRYVIEPIPGIMAAADVESLVAAIGKRRSKPPTPANGGDGWAYVHTIADWQVGKTDYGQGSEQTVQRILGALDRSVDTIKRSKRPLDSIVLASLGDLCEGIVSQKGAIALTSDLSVTDQLTVVRRLLLEHVKALAPLTPRLVVPTVPGNHDEPHRLLGASPKANDSFALMVTKAVADACALAGGFDNVEFVFPDVDDLTVTVEAAGTVIGLAHGHQFRQGKGHDWWAKQAHARHRIAAADLLLTGHYHHFRAWDDAGERTWIQCPTVDPGSSWFEQKQGGGARAGVLTFWVRDGIWEEMIIR